MSRRKKAKTRTIHMDAETAQIVEQQRQAFIAKFGRDWGPHDPIFFDPDADTPQVMSEEKVLGEVVSAMTKAGIDPMLIHAYKRTGGMLVTEDNRALWPAEDLAEWNAACDEYLELERQSN